MQLVSYYLVDCSIHSDSTYIGTWHIQEANLSLIKQELTNLDG